MLTPLSSPVPRNRGESPCRLHQAVSRPATEQMLLTLDPSRLLMTAVQATHPELNPTSRHSARKLSHCSTRENVTGPRAIGLDDSSSSFSLPPTQSCSSLQTSCSLQHYGPTALDGDVALIPSAARTWTIPDRQKPTASETSHSFFQGKLRSKTKAVVSASWVLKRLPKLTRPQCVLCQMRVPKVPHIPV